MLQHQVIQKREIYGTHQRKKNIRARIQCELKFYLKTNEPKMKALASPNKTTVTGDYIYF